MFVPHKITSVDLLALASSAVSKAGGDQAKAMTTLRESGNDDAARLLQGYRHTPEKGWHK